MHALPTAVILNEHLIEAMRRLKRDSGENSVDRYAAAYAHIRVSSLTRGFLHAAASCRTFSSLSSPPRAATRSDSRCCSSSRRSSPGPMTSEKKSASSALRELSRPVASSRAVEPEQEGMRGAGKERRWRTKGSRMR